MHEPSKLYLVYRKCPEQLTLELSGAEGVFEVEWFNFSMREDGFEFDKFLLTTNSKPMKSKTGELGTPASPLVEPKRVSARSVIWSRKDGR